MSVSAAGLTAVFRETVVTAIAALQRERFLAVVVGHRTAQVDVLELVLNIRNMDERIRIFVLSGKGMERTGLRLREHLSVVCRDEFMRKLRPTGMAVPDDRPRNPSMDLRGCEGPTKAGT